MSPSTWPFILNGSAPPCQPPSAADYSTLFFLPSETTRMIINLDKVKRGTPFESCFGAGFKNIPNIQIAKLEPLKKARLIEDTFMDVTDGTREKKSLIDVKVKGASNYRVWDSQFQDWLLKQDLCAEHYEMGLISRNFIDPSVVKHYKNYDVESFRQLVDDIDATLKAFLIETLSAAHIQIKKKNKKKFHTLKNKIDEYCSFEAVGEWYQEAHGVMWIDTSTRFTKNTPTPYTKHTFLWSTYHEYHIVNDTSLFWYMNETNPKKEESQGRPPVHGIGVLRIRLKTGQPLILPHVAYVPGSELIYSEIAARKVGRSIKLTKNDIRGRRQIGRISPRPLVDLEILSMNLLPRETKPKAETVEQWGELESEEFSEEYCEDESEEGSEEESEEGSEEGSEEESE